MTYQRNACGRGRQQHALLLITDNIKRLALSQRPDFQDVETGSPALLDGESLPILKEPDAAKKNSDHQNQGAKNTDDRSPRIRQCAGKRGKIRVG